MIDFGGEASPVGNRIEAQARQFGRLVRSAMEPPIVQRRWDDRSARRHESDHQDRRDGKPGDVQAGPRNDTVRSDGRTDLWLRAGFGPIASDDRK